jgi:predicted dehydrogenase
VRSVQPQSTEIRVGIIGANVRYGWGRDAHIPALSALPEFEICTSRQETADETAKHFGIPHAFADPYKMVQHPDVDLVLMWPSNATSCLTRFRRRRTPGSARFFSDDRPTA